MVSFAGYMLGACPNLVAAGKYGKESTSSSEVIFDNIHCYSVPARAQKNIYIYNGNPQTSWVIYQV